jgi:hypothetical protein
MNHAYTPATVTMMASELRNDCERNRNSKPIVLKELTVTQLAQKFHAFFGTRKSKCS